MVIIDIYDIAHLYVENARYLVALKKEERKGAFENI